MNSRAFRGLRFDSRSKSQDLLPHLVSLLLKQPYLWK